MEEFFVQKQVLEDSQTTNKEYFYNMQFFKFIFAIFIVTLHIFCVFFPGHKLFGLYICVEFFFMLNGFLLARSIRNKSKNEISIKNIIINKVKKFYPIYFISFVLIFFAYPYSFDFSRLIELLMLQSFVALSIINIPSWYISSYLIATAGFLILYKFIKTEKVFRIVTLSISFLVLSYYIFYLKTLSTWHQNIFYYIFNLGTLRGFAEISLGYLLFQYQDKIKEVLNRFRINSTLVSLIEISVIYFIFKFMFNPDLPNYYLILQVILFMALITLLYLKKGFISNILNLKCFNYLGIISYPIYLGHFIFITYLERHLLDSMILTKIVIMYGGTLIYAILIDFLLNIFTSIFNQIVSKNKKLQEIAS